MKTLKIKYLLSSLIILLCIEVSAQQESQYTHYMYNLMNVNPAYAGTRGVSNVSLLSRTQWSGFDNNPCTNMVSAHTPFQSGQTGAGITIMSDYISPVHNLYLDLNYAYRVMLGKDLTLSLGIKASMLNSNAKLSSLVPNDPAFQDGNYFNFNAGLGAYLYAENYYVGVSVPRILENKIKSGDAELGKISRLYYLTAGYVFDLNEDFKLKPSTFARMMTGAPIAWDVAVEAMYAERYSFGVNYRLKDAVSLMASARFFDSFTVSYAYEIAASKVTKRSAGSHEIFLSYDFAGFSKRKIKSPRFF